MISSFFELALRVSTGKMPVPHMRFGGVLMAVAGVSGWFAADFSAAASFGPGGRRDDGFIVMMR